MKEQLHGSLLDPLGKQGNNFTRSLSEPQYKHMRSVTVTSCAELVMILLKLCPFLYNIEVLTVRAAVSNFHHLLAFHFAANRDIAM